MRHHVAYWSDLPRESRRSFSRPFAIRMAGMAAPASLCDPPYAAAVLMERAQSPQASRSSFLGFCYSCFSEPYAIPAQPSPTPLVEAKMTIDVAPFCRATVVGYNHAIFAASHMARWRYGGEGARTTVPSSGIWRSPPPTIRSPLPLATSCSGSAVDAACRRRIHDTR